MRSPVSADRAALFYIACSMTLFCGLSLQYPVFAAEDLSFSSPAESQLSDRTSALSAQRSEASAYQQLLSGERSDIALSEGGSLSEGSAVLADPDISEQHSLLSRILKKVPAEEDQSVHSEDNDGFFLPVQAVSFDKKSSGIALSKMPFVMDITHDGDVLLPEDEYTKTYLNAFAVGFRYFSYLLHQNNVFRGGYKIPVVFLTRSSAEKAVKERASFSPFPVSGDEDRVSGNAISEVADRLYPAEHACAGMGVLQADLLGKCRADITYNLSVGAVVLAPLPKSITYEGVYDGDTVSITPNVMKINPTAQGLEAAVRLSGFFSPLNIEYKTNPDGSRSAVDASFSEVPSVFDRHLYSNVSRSFVKPGQKFSEIHPRCTLRSQQNCGFYFVGADTARFLRLNSKENGGNRFDSFSLGHSAELNAGIIFSDKGFITDRKGSGHFTVSSLDLARINNLAPSCKSRSDAVKKVLHDHTYAASENKGYDAKKAGSGSASFKARCKSESSDLSAEESSQENGSAALNEAKDYTGSVVSVNYGIPVFFNEYGQPLLGLRNTLLSVGDYRNYSFLTELEMMVLSDLGYSIESAEFYGNSVYSFGRRRERLQHKITQGFGLYDHENKSYSSLVGSEVPMAVGLHVYGDYNDLYQSSLFNMAGDGSIGVRIDGSSNTYMQRAGSEIFLSGADSAGIAFTYGRNNSALILGKVSAPGQKGVGIRVDMGSNVNSDLVEYRGSFIRVRSLDRINGILSKEEAQALPLPEELKGPQVQNITVGGAVEGKRAAVLIDESSFVREIDLLPGAVINGRILSAWNPYTASGDTFMIRHEGRRSRMLEGKIQVSANDPEVDGREFAIKHLSSYINLGRKTENNEDGKELMSEAAASFVPAADSVFTDRKPDEKVTVNGDISGGAFIVINRSGRNEIKGNLRAFELRTESGILDLSGYDGAIHQLNRINLHPYSVLDLADGKSSHTYVQEHVHVGRRAVFRVDADENGHLLDDITYMGDFTADDYQIIIEPAVNHEIMKVLGSDPKKLLDFLAVFIQKSNERFGPQSITLRFPRYIWSSTGSYGRELKCGARGCRMGGFIAVSRTAAPESIDPIRYYISFGGIMLFALFFVIRQRVIFYRRKKLSERRSALQAARGS